MNAMTTYSRLLSVVLVSINTQMSPNMLPLVVSTSFKPYFWRAIKTNPMFLMTKLASVKNTAIIIAFRRTSLDSVCVLNILLKFKNINGEHRMAIPIAMSVKTHKVVLRYARAVS